MGISASNYIYIKATFKLTLRRLCNYQIVKKLLKIFKYQKVNDLFKILPCKLWRYKFTELVRWFVFHFALIANFSPPIYGKIIKQTWVSHFVNWQTILDEVKTIKLNPVHMGLATWSQKNLPATGRSLHLCICRLYDPQGISIYSLLWHIHYIIQYFLDFQPFHL